MGMLNYLDNEMSMPMGKMDSSGLGDLKWPDSTILHNGITDEESI